MYIMYKFKNKAYFRLPINCIWALIGDIKYGYGKIKHRISQNAWLIKWSVCLS